MKTIGQKQLSVEFISALDAMDNSSREPLMIDLHGKKFVVVKDKDYRGWIETTYLLSSSKNARILQQAIEEPLGNCRDLNDVQKDIDR